MKIACILAKDFEDSELSVPLEQLRAAGHQVDIIGMKAGDKLAGKKGKAKVKADRGIDAVSAEDYDALLIPGGYSPDQLRADDRFVELVRDFFTADKPTAAVCHGPQILITAGVTKGRRMTAWKTIQVDLGFTGADVVDEQVVVDGNLVTSRMPDDLDAFCREFLSVLERQPSAPRPELLHPLV